jgi:ATP-dependent exoDNAse (exonuclease V) alpha subunit
VLNKSAKPFGGKQMIVFGDLFQLPPITMWQETKYLTDYYGGIFFFNSNAYSNGRFNFIELSTNHRQKDDKAFFDILNRMREGITTKEDIDCLNERHIDRKADKSELRRILTLFPKKADAERVNREELAKIEAKEYVYKAKIVYNAKNSQKSNLYKSFPISDELRLKRGALVMMVANDPEKRWVNGTMGVIHSLSADSINVTIDGTTYEVKPCVFTEKEAIYVDGKIDYQDILRVEQYPIVLAYAITIHKSQGMTYKKIACDISNCFAPGQAYVALSRCSSLAGLNLLKLIDESLMKVDENVMKFYLSQSTEETIKRFK